MRGRRRCTPGWSPARSAARGTTRRTAREATLRAAIEAVSVGKVSGSVGTFAHASPKVEEYVTRKLGLRAAPVSTQVVQRDVHAEFVCALALTAAALEQFATEVRALQKTETLEAEEPFK